LFDERPFPTKQSAKQSLVAAMRQNDIANGASSGQKNLGWSCGHSSLKGELDAGSILGCAVGRIHVNGSDRKSVDFQNSDGTDDTFCEVSSTGSQLQKRAKTSVSEWARKLGIAARPGVKMRNGFNSKNVRLM
jgi:hypothetical protein